MQPVNTGERMGVALRAGIEGGKTLSVVLLASPTSGKRRREEKKHASLRVFLTLASIFTRSKLNEFSNFVLFV